MDREQLGAGWQELAAEVTQELVAWRQAHPRATLAELEQVVQQAVSRLQARYLTDLVHASGLTDLTAVPLEERPRCPACGGLLRARGQRERSVLVPRQAEPLRLERSYGVCSACGTGLFPPG